jgi:hypothetical protein
MKIYRFEDFSTKRYEDGLIKISIDSKKCKNVSTLIEHAVMNSFYEIEDLAKLYECLGDEFGKGHLNAQETILILNSFDEKLLKKISALMREQDVTEYNSSTHKLYDSVRREFISARNLVDVAFLSNPNGDVPNCKTIKPFEWHKPSLGLVGEF